MSLHHLSEGRWRLGNSQRSFTELRAKTIIYGVKDLLFLHAGNAYHPRRSQKANNMVEVIHSWSPRPIAIDGGGLKSLDRGARFSSKFMEQSYDRNWGVVLEDPQIMRMDGYAGSLLFLIPSRFDDLW